MRERPLLLLRVLPRRTSRPKRVSQLGIGPRQNDRHQYHAPVLTCFPFPNDPPSLSSSGPIVFTGNIVLGYLMGANFRRV